MQKKFYLIKNPLLKIPIQIADFVGYKLFKKRNSLSRFSPQKILLCNCAHLGDAVIFSAIIPAIKAACPGVSLGILIGSWSTVLFENHPEIKWIHSLDHWKLNRQSISLSKKLCRHFITKRKTIKCLKKIEYDLAIDFYPFFPNTSYLLWQSKIPIRIGYNSGGFGFFYSHDVNWQTSSRFILEYMFDLLKIPIPKITQTKLDKPSLKPIPKIGFSKLTKYIEKQKSSYIIHPCSGNEQKELTVNQWKHIVNRFSLQNIPLFFTGKGQREKLKIDQIILAKKNCFSLVDKLSIDELCFIISKSKALLTSDSLPVHIAWQYEKPTIIFQTGTNDPKLWTPPNPNNIVCFNEYHFDVIFNDILSSKFN
jgi:heptosyltransferase-2